MRKILVTGGTVFVSKAVAEYFVKKGDAVTVLNRGSRAQVCGVELLKADRNQLGEVLKGKHFDAVLDVTAYNGDDVNHLLDSGVTFEDYVLISSSAVYPESGKQPFSETEPVGENQFWAAYGTGKIAAEKALLDRVPQAYCLRPPYLYGPYNNVYREAFVFDCAMEDRPFYLPKDGGMKLQFFHVVDLCRLIDRILETRPRQHILNVGNREQISVREWVELCYEIAGNKPEFVEVYQETQQRNYFSFYEYEYCLDVSRQAAILPETKKLTEGLTEAFAWYREHAGEVNKKPYFEYIDNVLQK